MGMWRPRFGHLAIVIVLAVSSLIHNILMNGANNVIISSLQKEFYLSSKETGVYVSVYDIGALASSVVVPFAGANNKPRWIAGGLFMLFLGCSVNVTPHFFKTMAMTSAANAAHQASFHLNASAVNPISSVTSTVELCNASLLAVAAQGGDVTLTPLARSTHTSTGGARIGKFQLKHLLYAANIINGMSSASVTTLVFSYIEDIAPAHLSSTYESVYFAVGALGVGVGFIVTSKFLTIHTDINLGEPTPPWLVPSHPNWIGAWWLPFILFGGLVALVAILICTFPRKLRSTEKEEAARKADEANANSVEMKLLPKNGEKSNGDVKGKPAVAWHSSASAALGNVKYEQHDDNADAISMDSAHSATARRRHHHHNPLIRTMEMNGSLLSLSQLGAHSKFAHHHSSPNIHRRASEQPDEEQAVKKNRDSTPPNVEQLSTHGDEPHTLRESLTQALRLIRNPIYVFIIITTAIEGLLQNSFLAFAALFLEYQYRLSSGKASLVLGLLSIPPLIFGGILSGLIVRRFKNRMRPCLQFLSCILAFNILVYAGFLLYCRESNIISDLAGNKPASSAAAAATRACYSASTHCYCDATVFRPICLTAAGQQDKDVVFQSPCLAGCSFFDELTNFYTNCTQAQGTCTNYNTASPFANMTDTSGEFINGLCPASSSCSLRLAIVYVCIFLLMFINALTFIPYLKVTIGCVDSKEMNAVALGMKQLVMNACGTIPGPILFGAVIDSTCIYWHVDAHSQATCKLYNNEKFSLGFGLLGISFKAVCFFFILLSLILFPRFIHHEAHYEGDEKSSKTDNNAQDTTVATRS